MLVKKVINVYGLIRSRLFYFSSSFQGECLLSKEIPVTEANLYMAQSQNIKLYYVT